VLEHDIDRLAGPVWLLHFGAALLPLFPLSTSGFFVPKPSTGQATRAVACLTSGVVSTAVYQRPWLIVMEVTHLVRGGGS
jgi:hypothetical protein